MNTTLDTRRHMELFDPDTFNTPIHIIGAGATGSWLALMFAKLGVKGDLINLYDFDEVEPHNIPNQAFGLTDIGRTKVEAMEAIIKLETGTSIKAHNRRFTSDRLSGYVFTMVDTMEGRKTIWENSVKMKSAVKHYVEPRMGLDVGRIYNVDPTELEHIRQYENTFYSDEEAEVSACGTSQTVITTSIAIASYCTRQLINRENECELDNEILIDFIYNNLITTKW